jgi:hypothetical protein
MRLPDNSRKTVGVSSAPRQEPVSFPIVSWRAAAPFALLSLLACLLISAHGEIIDRLAVAVGSQIITQLQLDEELRTTAMLNHKPVVRDLEARRGAADRLVEQLLIRHEMELSRYPLPDAGDIDKYLQQVIESNGGEAEFNKVLQSFDLSVETLRKHLELQLTELRFIEYRFRPDTGVSEAEVEAAYQREVATWKQSHSGVPPALEVSREPLRAMLVEEHIDAALNTWLGESRKQIALVYFDKTLE